MSKKTNRYTSHVIQNECMQIMAHEIMRKIAGIIRKCKCYTIMADECTDVSNKQQFNVFDVLLKILKTKSTSLAFMK